MVKRRYSNSGFTLTELMVVVVIVGTLAALAVVGIRGYMIRARQAEAIAMIQAIRAAQEAHKAETNSYLDVSSSMTAFYPRATPDSEYVAFRSTSHADRTKWDALNPTAPGQGVRWVYVSKAGLPGTTPPNLTVDGTVSHSGPVPRGWYVIQAMGDTDGDGRVIYMAAASTSGTVLRGRGGD